MLYRRVTEYVRAEFNRADPLENESTEQEVVDQAIAARTVAELQAEISQLEESEQLALRVRRRGTDKKWGELSKLLQNEATLFDAHGHHIVQVCNGN